tara:strand:- start:253 stop:1020 length:768 start_codon:yes stop_codon:yes gene_type:complete
MKKFHFIFDKTSVKSQKLETSFLKRYKNFSAKKSECIVVCGGDGFMLKALRRYSKIKKPFYGINCGTFGFLMNNYQNHDFINKINNSKKIVINPLEVVSIDNKNKKKRLIAINEASLFRQSKQTSSLKLKIGKSIVLRKLIGDGILVATPAGSTAYNLSVNGQILSLNSGKIAITPISPFRPRRWKGKIISNNLLVEIENLDVNKRPVALVADNVEIRKIKKIKVQVNKNIKIVLLYNSNRSLVKRIKIEQSRIK